MECSQDEGYSLLYLRLGTWIGTSLDEFNDSIFLIEFTGDMKWSLPELINRSGHTREKSIRREGERMVEG
jgi:hypothetical protein